MRRLKVWLLGLLVVADWRRARRATRRARIVPPGDPDRRAENAVILLLLAAIGSAFGFVAIFAIGPSNMTQWLGLTLGAAFAFVAAALIVVGKRLVVTEEIEEEYPEEHPADQEAVAQVVVESGSRFTRKRLLMALGGTATAALGAALAAPAISLGPIFDTGTLYETPWERGRRLVDDDGEPLLADDIEEGTFYTAYPEGADRALLGAPVVLVRLPVEELALPPERAGWAPEGILAYSKICTHAGCAIALYRHPTFAPTQPRPALVCPCHYSTFDPAAGAEVTFGPAGRALPQLPLMVGTAGELRAGGRFSDPVGPAWWGVRSGEPS